jgi:AAA domain
LNQFTTTPTARIEQPAPFRFKFLKPSQHPEDRTVSYLVDKLFPEGGFCSIVAKPKGSKSSLARYLATCVAKGQPFLGREIKVRGEVLILSVEDTLSISRASLEALGWKEDADENIYIETIVPGSLDVTIDALREGLADHPNINLVIFDTLPKVVHVRDSNEYSQWLPIFDKVKQLRREFPHVTFIGTAHARKGSSDDRFDSVLGSSAIRGEFETNVLLYQQDGKRLIVSENRVGKAIEPTILEAQIVEAEEGDFVSSFALGARFSEWEDERNEASDAKRKVSVKDRLVIYLKERQGEYIPQSTVLKDVKGNSQSKCATIKEMIAEGLIMTTGVPNSTLDPYSLALNMDALPIYELSKIGKNRKRSMEEPGHEKETIQ